jgi:hypothetical protein
MNARRRRIYELALSTAIILATAQLRPTGANAEDGVTVTTLNYSFFYWEYGSHGYAIDIFYKIKNGEARTIKSVEVLCMAETVTGMPYGSSITRNLAPNAELEGKIEIRVRENPEVILSAPCTVVKVED